MQVIGWMRPSRWMRKPVRRVLPDVRSLRQLSERLVMFLKVSPYPG